MVIDHVEMGPEPGEVSVYCAPFDRLILRMDAPLTLIGVPQEVADLRYG